MIDVVRQKYGISGVDYNKASSLEGDCKKLDNTMMFWEDYGLDYTLQGHD